MPNANGNAISSTTSTTDAATGKTVALQTTTEFDRENRPMLVTLPDNTKNYTHYNSTGKVDYSIAATNASYNGVSLARTTQHRYDAQGRRYLTQSPDGGHSRTFYDKESQVTSNVGRAGRGSETVYDNLGRVYLSYVLKLGGAKGEGVTDSNGNALYTQTKYDELDRAIASRDLRGQWSYTRYKVVSEATAWQTHRLRRNGGQRPNRSHAAREQSHSRVCLRRCGTFSQRREPRRRRRGLSVGLGFGQGRQSHARNVAQDQRRERNELSRAFFDAGRIELQFDRHQLAHAHFFHARHAQCSGDGLRRRHD